MWSVSGMTSKMISYVSICKQRNHAGKIEAFKLTQEITNFNSIQITLWHPTGVCNCDKNYLMDLCDSGIIQSTYQAFYDQLSVEEKNTQTAKTRCN